MKVLSPTISVVMASHMKPSWLPSALDSLVHQTRCDMQIIVIDSGEWIDQPGFAAERMQDIYDQYAKHPFVEWYTLGEPPRLIERKCPYAYIWNKAIRELVRGKYVCFATDDDLHSPLYMERMAGFLDENPDRRAVYCAQNRMRHGLVDWVIPADIPRHGDSFDTHIDMLQMMLRRDIFEDLEDPWFAEDADTDICRHSDGLFMNKVGLLLTEVPNISDILVSHRHTPDSTYN